MAIFNYLNFLIIVQSAYRKIIKIMKKMIYIFIFYKNLCLYFLQSFKMTPLHFKNTEIKD